MENQVKFCSPQNIFGASQGFAETWIMPADSGVQENAATLLCHEAPRMLHGLWNLTWLSISVGGGE